MKTINKQADNNQAVYSHMEPIVDFLLQNGNELFYTNSKWGSDRTGYLCWLKKPIDKALVLANFNLPETIKMSETGDMDCYITSTRIKYVEK
ncbi:hypothetical protein [Psychromonas algicola]|uniref:hypothetical protein n=1 Tax=Psychromonas algicola TaxID=2555642 RepID=UPI0010689E8C|nr:hypothetical protein [Psychromonas sp. RZ5]TEW45740.1 hypothetical protein E2R67_13805 [Psychromonas sp. RZ5]